MNRKKKKCTEKGCRSKSIAKGLCRKHYKKQWLEKAAENPVKKEPPKMCAVDGCKRRHCAKGMCSLHYQRARRLDIASGWSNKKQLALPDVDTRRSWEMTAAEIWGKDGNH